MTILTSREADPQIRHAIMTGEPISDDVAQTIAAGLHSPAERDVPLTALSHGLDFDAVALLGRVVELIKSPEFTASDVLPDLWALHAWTLTRVPHVSVTTYRLDADTWVRLNEEWGGGGPTPPEGIEPDGVDVTVVADVQDDLGSWSYPGDGDYPDDPEGAGYEVDADDGSVWLRLPVVDTAAKMLTGDHTEFWAQSYGDVSDPFASGLYWGQSAPFAVIGPGKVYASQYIHPHTGDVEIKVAVLGGFTPDQEAAVYRGWKR